ncbi:GntR family transcriptional regulator [Cryobacterium sp. MDB2-33-2]|uniref:GntR family transcriptional regulator n=1 Tax=Cryobacterium sp. MDB2-33-2 TaxID=1259179 RepID=UPI00141AE98B|nr:GntR family transcriptional regulator [Cryobacterium sp. MDB2-33-2]
MNTSSAEHRSSVHEELGIEILMGHLAAGTKLPPQRHWGGGEVHAATDTVRNQYARLEAMGLVIAHSSRRKVVAPGAAASEPLRVATQELVGVSRSDGRSLETTILLLRGLWRQTEATEYQADAWLNFSADVLPGSTRIGAETPPEAAGPEDDAYDQERSAVGNDGDDDDFKSGI